MQRIRFIDPHYNELFTIANGEKIKITRLNGEEVIRKCEYIDPYHLYVDRCVFHICEFAERMEENKNTVKPLLPDMAYALLPSSGELIVIKRSEDGYQKTDFSTSDREKNEAIRDFQNEKLGVSKAESEALLNGSLFGYGAKAADTRSYDESGKPIKVGKSKEEER